jgi:hypothetical protein
MTNRLHNSFKIKDNSLTGRNYDRNKKQARSSLYANTQLRAHRRAEKKIKSKKYMEDRLPEPITLQTRQNSIGKFLCTMRL